MNGSSTSGPGGYQQHHRRFLDALGILIRRPEGNCKRSRESVYKQPLQQPQRAGRVSVEVGDCVPSPSERYDREDTQKLEERPDSQSRRVDAVTSVGTVRSESSSKI